MTKLIAGIRKIIEARAWVDTAAAAPASSSPAVVPARRRSRQSASLALEPAVGFPCPTLALGRETSIALPRRMQPVEQPTLGGFLLLRLFRNSQRGAGVSVHAWRNEPCAR